MGVKLNITPSMLSSSSTNRIGLPYLYAESESLSPDVSMERFLHANIMALSSERITNK
jgi:hypothetical protein